MKKEMKILLISKKQMITIKTFENNISLDYIKEKLQSKQVSSIQLKDNIVAFISNKKTNSYLVEFDDSTFKIIDGDFILLKNNLSPLADEDYAKIMINFRISKLV